MTIHACHDGERVGSIRAVPLFSSSRTTGGSLPGQRSVVMARHGMVATSQPLASLAALDALRAGGSAADAAVTAVAVQSVVEPHSTGIGGDCFCLYWSARERRVHAYNGSGRSPAAATREALETAGISRVPVHGPLPITVPGALDAWAAILERFGRRSLAAALGPAITQAHEGFPVSEVIAREWRLAHEIGALARPEAARVFLPGGAPPRPGRIVRLPDLARTLEAVARGGPGSFYTGELGERTVAAVRADGGCLSREDMEAHRGEWVAPISTTYRDLTVVEAPPNGQGLAALLGLNMLEGFDLAGARWDDPSLIHYRIEATRRALADRDRFLADPAVATVPTAALLDKAYARTRAATIARDRASHGIDAGHPLGRDTVFVATADADGDMCALINSLFFPFGSGVVVPHTGIVLQNRGSSFTLDARHPNCLAPRKRPFHTIIPGMALRNGAALLAFGIMGGNVQAQAHIQTISNIVDCGLNPQEAIDAPRFHSLGTEVACEDGYPDAVRAELAARGHHVVPALAALAWGGFGGGQAVARDDREGVYWGASDARKDGCALGY